MIYSFKKSRVTLLLSLSALAILLFFQNCGQFKTVTGDESASLLSTSPNPSPSPNPAPNPTPTPVIPSVELAWDNGTNSAPDHFVIEQSLDGKTFAQIDSVQEPTHTATISHLTSGQTYYFRIQAINAAGDSAYSTLVTASIPASTN